MRRAGIFRAMLDDGAMHFEAGDIRVAAERAAERETVVSKLLNERAALPRLMGAIVKMEESRATARKSAGSFGCVLTSSYSGDNWTRGLKIVCLALAAHAHECGEACISYLIFGRKLYQVLLF